MRVTSSARRALAVRAVAAVGTDGDADGTTRVVRRRERRAQRLELARLGARIARAVNHERRHAQRRQPAAVQIAVGAVVAQSAARPSPLIEIDSRQPSPCSRASTAVTRSPRPSGSSHHRLEERARRRLAPKEVRRLGDHAADAFRRVQRHQQRDDRAVAVSPEHRAIERRARRSAASVSSAAR